MSIFIRNILIDLDEVSEGLMRVRTSIKDVVHDIVLTLFVKFPEYIIEEVELDMKEAPEKNCPLFKELIGEIRGMTIGKGFNSEIRKIFRGKTGCPTVTGLLTIAAPLVINISWFIERKKRGLSDEQYLVLKKKVMKDKCIAFSSTMDNYNNAEVTGGEMAIQRDCENCPSLDENGNIRGNILLKLQSLAGRYNIPQEAIKDIKDDIEKITNDR